MPPPAPASQPISAVEPTSTPLFIDTHADTAQRFADEAWSFTDPLGTGHLNLPSARAAHLSAEFFAIWPEPTQWRNRYAHRTLELIDSVLEQVRRHPRDLALCTTADAILSAHRAGRFAVLLGIEGGHAIENSLALLRTYFHLGVRYMTLTWANSNDWAESSGNLPMHDPDAPDPDAATPDNPRAPDAPRPCGLTPFGHEVIHEMNRLGMMVDVSHISDRTLADVLATTRAPVLASHSCARALTAAPRNLTDDQLRAIARNRGAVMVNFYPAFIDETWRAAWNALGPEIQAAQATLEAAYKQRGQPVPHHAANRIERSFASRIPRPALRALIDHIDHIAEVAGIDHVGIGTDFDGIPALPQGIDSAADLGKLAPALADRAYSPAAIAKILGGNLLRVLREVEHAADKPHPPERQA